MEVVSHHDEGRAMLACIRCGVHEALRAALAAKVRRGGTRSTARAGGGADGCCSFRSQQAHTGWVGVGVKKGFPHCFPEAEGWHEVVAGRAAGLWLDMGPIDLPRAHRHRRKGLAWRASIHMRLALAQRLSLAAAGLSLACRRLQLAGGGELRHRRTAVGIADRWRKAAVVAPPRTKTRASSRRCLNLRPSCCLDLRVKVYEGRAVSGSTWRTTAGIGTRWR